MRDIDNSILADDYLRSKLRNLIDLSANRYSRALVDGGTRRIVARVENLPLLIQPDRISLIW